MFEHGDSVNPEVAFRVVSFGYLYTNKPAGRKHTFVWQIKDRLS